MQVLVVLKQPELDAMPIERLTGTFADVRVEKVEAMAAASDLASVELLVTIGPALGIDAERLFGAARALRWVQSIGTGVDNLLGHPALPPEVVVTNVRGIHGAQMAEAVIAAMLALARDLPRTVRNQQAGRWERFAPRLLAGGAAGILGTGAIASALAPRLKALGMDVTGISANPRPLPDFDRVEPRDALVRVVGDLDFLILLAPYGPDTHHIVGAELLAAMKPGACLVNFARGGVVDEAALLDALDGGRIAGAALDVFALEPLAADSPFWAHPRVIVTPHLGGFHAGYPEQVYAVIADNVARYRAGGVDALLNRVN